MTARYRIKEEAGAVSIELTEVGQHRERLMTAFGECQSGRCSCPTNEYDKLASMEVEESADAIKLRLETRPGEQLDVVQIAGCLDYTTRAT